MANQKSPLLEAGYTSRAYARSFSEIGRCDHLRESGGWLISRQIGASAFRDAMGCYPVFACKNWDALADDLERIGPALVSVSAVPDPMARFSVETLRQAFPDLCVPFKYHYVADLEQPLESFISSHHRRNARKATKELVVERCEPPTEHHHEWCQIYEQLILRHGLTGVSAFSRRAFHKQLQVPGVVLFRARMQSQTVGMAIWYICGDVAYYHLGAATDQGYLRGASFAIFWEAFSQFRDSGLRFINLGGQAGADTKGRESGLARFKRGWSNQTRTAYICGRILDRGRYEALVAETGTAAETYFPAYRAGEYR